MGKLKIAVLMACHNRREKTMQCLNSLRDSVGELRSKEQASAEVHIFLVDDGSTDGTSEAVKDWGNLITSHSSPITLHLIRGSGSLFWARGMALAWREALKYERATNAPILPFSFDHFLWLNDDVVLKPSALMDAYEDWKRCGDLFGVIVGACSADSSEKKSSYSATDLNDSQLFPDGKAPRRAAGWFNGNFVLVPRETFGQVGMISDRYKHARADYDYAERLKCGGIPFFVSSRFIGVCEPNDFWTRIKSVPRCERLRLMFCPGPLSLHDLWLYRCSHYGLVRAIVSCFHFLFMVLR